jgi:hypothetical protein
MNTVKDTGWMWDGFVWIIAGSSVGPFRKDDHMDIIEGEEFLDKMITVSSGRTL